MLAGFALFVVLGLLSLPLLVLVILGESTKRKSAEQVRDEWCVVLLGGLIGVAAIAATCWACGVFEVLS